MFSYVSTHTQTDQQRQSHTHQQSTLINIHKHIPTHLSVDEDGEAVNIHTQIHLSQSHTQPTNIPPPTHT